jgi:CheY-like chemotaxis protein
MTLDVSNLDLKGKNLVIVEDDLPSVRYYEHILKKSGAEVKICYTGKEFAEYITLAENRVDLVFMDFLIPIINGIECIRTLRKERKGVPVIMITAYPSEQVKTEAFVAGCTEFVLKPIYPEKIYFLIDKYLINKIPSTITNAT